jgi:bifunctional non-homologous end joining protein LigD
MPSAVQPMLATLVDKPFSDKDWLFEIKWDGFRAIAYVRGGSVPLVSRNQNNLSAEFPELKDLGSYVKAREAVLDGEIVALDANGLPSFSLMQQRTGFRGAANRRLPIVFYAFDLLYLDGYSLMRVDLIERKRLLSEILASSDIVRLSDHVEAEGLKLFEVAGERGLEGIVAKRAKSCYIPKRTREWLKMKITKRQECVIGGYTDPRGSRENFGSIVLGLYDDKGRLIPVGQAGSGFNDETHVDMWARLRKLQTDKSPFAMKPDSSRRVHFVKPELVAEIKFSEWTHTTEAGGRKMRAPIYQGLRFDKAPQECVFDDAKPAAQEKNRAERGDAA